MNQDELYGEDIGYPAYLYPTQDTNCYDRERIDHYISIFQSAKSNPRAIVYNFADAISFVIDGHHKICAAALLQQMVYCIIIIPYEVSRNSSAVFNGSGHQKMRVSHGEINHRKWEEEYQETTNCYPNINKFIEYMKYLDCFAEMVVDEKIRLLQYDDSDAGQIKKSAILTAMQISDDARLKETALLFLNSSVETNTLVTIYRVLAGIKDDPRSSVFLWSILLNILTRMTQL